MSIQSVSASNSINNTLKAAAEEATETAAQTAREAAHGDRQAQRLLAKQAAAEHESQVAASKAPTVNTRGELTGTIVNTSA